MSPPWTRSTAGLILGAIATAAFVRLWELGGKSLWLDELFSVRVARRESWAGLVEELSSDVHPPLYFALLRLWEPVAGSNDALWRLPAAVAGIAAVAVTATLGRRLAGPAAGAAAAWLVAVSPMAIELDREVRGNALLVLFTTGAAAVAVGHGGGWRARVALAALTAGAVWTHPFGIFFAVGLAAWALADATDGYARAIAVGIGAATLAPWGTVLVGQVAGFADDPWYVPPSADSLGWLWPSLTGGLVAPSVLLAAAVGAAIAGGSTRAVRLLLAMVAALVLLPQGVSYVAAPVLRPRNIAPLVPIVAVAAAAGLTSLRPALVAPASALLVAVLGIGAWRVEVAAPAAEQWREAAQGLQAERKPGEPVYTNHPVLWWYYLGTDAGNQPLDGPLADAAATAWVLEGSFRVEAPVAALRGRGRATETGYRGAWRTRIDGLENTLGPTDFGGEAGDGTIHFYSGGLRPSRDVRLYGRCAVGVRGSGDAPEHGPARVRVVLSGLDGAVLSEATIDLGEGALWTPPVDLAGPARVGLDFVNDEVASDGTWDRNAHLTEVRLRCEAAE